MRSTATRDLFDDLEVGYQDEKYPDNKNNNPGGGVSHVGVKAEG